MIDWRHWHNEPWLVGGLVSLGWLWAILAGPLRARLAPEEKFPRAHARRFYASLLVFYFAVGSPLDQVGERFLFSAHMLQHQILIYPAAVLFLRGIPAWMMDPVFELSALRAFWRVVTHPVCAAVIFAVVIGTWHAPEFYDLALRNKLVHVLEHTMFFGAALIYWWPLLSPSRLVPRLRPGPQMLYLLGSTITITPVFAFITFSHDVLYPTYEFAPRLFANFSASDDQLLAGTGMQLVGVAVSMTTLAITFFQWYQAGERKPEKKPTGSRRDAEVVE